MPSWASLQGRSTAVRALKPPCGEPASPAASPARSGARNRACRDATRSIGIYECGGRCAPARHRGEGETTLSGANIGPALLLQLHDVHDARLDDLRLRNERNVLALLLLH